MITTYTFVARVAFLFEKHSKSYVGYDDASITEEKVAIAQKLIQATSFASWQEGAVCRS